ncbi:MAG: hypothetical protein ACLQDV_02980 [Candidatus Binataceae bacterium]
MNPAVIGALNLALWTLQRHQERHQRHAMRNYRGSTRARGLNPGNQMQSPLGYGF